MKKLVITNFFVIMIVVMYMKDISKVKCGKCGFENVLGSKTCVKCHATLKHTRKGCPKCAKVNSIDAKKCVKCGYDFSKKGNGIFKNLIISVIIVLVLALFLLFDNSLSKDISIGFKIAAGFIIVGIISSSINYASSEVIKFDAEEEMVDNVSKFKRMKLLSSLMVLIGIVLAAGFLIYYYILK